MLSNVTETTQSEGYANHVVWYRVVLDQMELQQAVEADGVATLVGAVLQPSYGMLKFYKDLVESVATAAKYAVIQRQATEKPLLSLGILYSSKFLSALALEETPAASSMTTSYWIGEANE